MERCDEPVWMEYGEFPRKFCVVCGAFASIRLCWADTPELDPRSGFPRASVIVALLPYFCDTHVEDAQMRLDAILASIRQRELLPEEPGTWPRRH